MLASPNSDGYSMIGEQPVTAVLNVGPGLGSAPTNRGDDCAPGS